jgi:hypothetical protein
MSGALDDGPIVATIFVCLTRPAYNRNFARPMTIKFWLENAIQDAERRGLTALRPLLEALARSTSALRSADWNSDATGESDSLPPPDAR